MMLWGWAAAGNSMVSLPPLLVSAKCLRSVETVTWHSVWLFYLISLCPLSPSWIVNHDLVKADNNDVVTSVGMGPDEDIIGKINYHIIHFIIVIEYQMQLLFCLRCIVSLSPVAGVNRSRSIRVTIVVLSEVRIKQLSLHCHHSRYEYKCNDVPSRIRYQRLRTFTWIVLK